VSNSFWQGRLTADVFIPGQPGARDYFLFFTFIIFVFLLNRNEYNTRYCCFSTALPSFRKSFDYQVSWIWTNI